MEQNELRRLIKIENRINQIVTEELKLNCYPIEFDVIPAQKMLEIMAYNIPTNISNWKYGREYEREKTIYEHSKRTLPYEVVINSNPAKAYLMKENRFAVQALVIAHVYGHVAFFTNNKYFQNSRQDIIGIMYEASKRFNEYERRYGVEEVEKTIDAGHALQRHSSPFEPRETEDEKRKRIFEQKKKQLYIHGGDFADFTNFDVDKINEDVELYNQKLWRKLKLKTPVEPTEDILRYLIDNSRVLEDWQKDILEVLRMEGQYYWPIIKTKIMNEGFAVLIHEKVINQLYKEGLLTNAEHAEFNYANSLVKGESPFNINPYLIGSKIWEDIEDRWNKGKYGRDWKNCMDAKTKLNWDTQELKGWEKCKSVMATYIDWFFIQEFLTLDLIQDLNLYLFEVKEKPQSIDYVISHRDAEKIKKKLVHFLAVNKIPTILIVEGNFNNRGQLKLQHKYDNIPLDKTYAEKTLKHVEYLWGNKVVLYTYDDDELVVIVSDNDAEKSTTEEE